MVCLALTVSICDRALRLTRQRPRDRFRRDIGYAAGTPVAGAPAGALNAAAILTAASGLLAARWITRRRPDTR